MSKYVSLPTSIQLNIIVLPNFQFKCVLNGASVSLTIVIGLNGAFIVGGEKKTVVLIPIFFDNHLSILTTSSANDWGARAHCFNQKPDLWTRIATQGCHCHECSDTRAYPAIEGGQQGAGQTFSEGEEQKKGNTAWKDGCEKTQPSKKKYDVLPIFPPCPPSSHRLSIFGPFTEQVFARRAWNAG